jgi:chemotaxis signal transduction protein
VSSERGLSARVSALREAFDGAFGQAHVPQADGALDFLVIESGGQRYALRLSQVLAVHADRKLVSAPSARPELLGLVGLRGAVAPVYDLARLLGLPTLARPRWLALVRGRLPLSLAFERFERHLRLGPGQVTPQGGARFTPGSLKTEQGLLPLIDLSAIYAELTRSPGDERL